MQTIHRSIGLQKVAQSCAIARPTSVRRSCTVVRAQDKRVNLSQALDAVGQELDALLREVESGVATQTEPSELHEENGLVCDENGCVLLTPPKGFAVKQDPTLGHAEPLTRMLSGKGWKIGRKIDSEGYEFNSLVGGDTWNVDLTQRELSDFLVALQMFKNTMKKMETSKGKDIPHLKWSQGTVQMEAIVVDLQKQDFDLKFQIGAGGLRCVGASWRAPVVHDMVKTLEEEVAGFAV